MYRLKQYTALDWLVRIPKWEYFDADSPEKAKEVANLTYSYGFAFSMVYKQPKLQQNINGKWINL